LGKREKGEKIPARDRKRPGPKENRKGGKSKDKRRKAKQKKKNRSKLCERRVFWKRISNHVFVVVVAGEGKEKKPKERASKAWFLKNLDFPQTSEKLREGAEK